MAAFLVFLLVITVVLVGTHQMPLAEWRKHQLPFDQSVWLSNPISPGPETIRLRMVDDLLATQNFKGMTRSQVQELLGNPADTKYFRHWNMIYWLGPERGAFRMDSEWLAFKFDQEDRVTEVAILKD